MYVRKYTTSGLFLLSTWEGRPPFWRWVDNTRCSTYLLFVLARIPGGKKHKRVLPCFVSDGQTDNLELTRSPVSLDNCASTRHGNHFALRNWIGARRKCGHVGWPTEHAVRAYVWTVPKVVLHYYPDTRFRSPFQFLLPHLSCLPPFHLEASTSTREIPNLSNCPCLLAVSLISTLYLFFRQNNSNV